MDSISDVLEAYLRCVEIRLPKWQAADLIEQQAAAKTPWQKWKTESWISKVEVLLSGKEARMGW